MHCELLDAQTYVDDSPLGALGHRHPTKRVIDGEVVSDHGMYEFFRRHVIGSLHAGLAESAAQDRKRSSNLFNPMFPSTRNLVGPLCARYASMSHHEKGKHSEHEFACEE